MTEKYENLNELLFHSIENEFNDVEFNKKGKEILDNLLDRIIKETHEEKIKWKRYLEKIEIYEILKKPEYKLDKSEILIGDLGLKAKSGNDITIPIFFMYHLYDHGSNIHLSTDLILNDIDRGPRYKEFLHLNQENIEKNKLFKLAVGYFGIVSIKE